VRLVKTWPAFSSRVRSIIKGSQTNGIIVFDPSGDASEPDSRLSVALPGGNPTLSVTVYDSAAGRVRTLEDWNQTASGVSWSGDDDTGAIVAPGMYTVIARRLDGRTTVILAEVRWHLH
jgi:flagellar hook assembly protein FlgD